MPDPEPSLTGSPSRHQRFRAIMDAAAGASSANYLNHSRFWNLPLAELRDFELYGIAMMRTNGGPSRATESNLCCHAGTAPAAPPAAPPGAARELPNRTSLSSPSGSPTVVRPRSRIATAGPKQTPPCASQVDRARFNEALRSVAEAADVAVWRPAGFQAAERRQNGRWCLTLSRHDRLGVVLADIVVDAIGRHACFAATQGSRPRFADRLVGVAGLIELGPADARRDHATLVEAREAGWWYSSLVPDGRLILVWMSDADLIHRGGLARRERSLEHLKTAPLTRQRALEGRFPHRLSTWPARSYCLDSVCGARWIAVGDAASVWDPLSSAGILKALRTGKLGAFAILDLLCGKANAMAKYRNCVVADYAHYQRHRQQVYRLEQRWRQAPFWRRRDESDAAPAVRKI